MVLDLSSINPDKSDDSSLPDYFKAADNHNYGNGNFAFTDPSTWIGGVESAAKFGAVAAISGVDSLVNSGIVATNWLTGSSNSEIDTQAQIASLDSSLGDYYAANKPSADLVGFIATSFLPGLGGVKVLSAGQEALRGVKAAGYLGENLSRATGLLIPQTELYTRLAAADILKGTEAFALTNTNTLKALGTGAIQGTLEGAAFQIAVNATMFRSPVLQGSDASDIAQDVVYSALGGGVLGGVISGAQNYYKIKELLKEGDKALRPSLAITDLPSSSVSDRIITRFNDLENVPTAEAVPEELQNTFNKNLAAREMKLGNLAQEDTLKLAGGDKVLASTLYGQLKGLEAEQVSNNLLHSTEVGRVGSTLDAEIKNARVKQGDEVPYKLGYVKLVGEGVGDISFDAPVLRSLADTYGSTKEVQDAVKGYKFSLNSPLQFGQETTHTGAEARYIWADTQVLNEGVKIGESDIPLLERAVDSKLNTINLVDKATGTVYPLQATDAIVAWTKEAKNSLISELLDEGSKSTEEIAKITNTKLSYVEGRVSSPDDLPDYFARQDTQSKYTADLVSKGLRKAEDGLVDMSGVPSYLKVAYDTSSLKQADGMLLEGMAYIKAKYNLYQDAYNNVFTKAIADPLSGNFYHPSDKALREAGREGAGASLLGFANGSYGSAASWAEYTGSQVKALKELFKSRATEVLHPLASKLALDTPSAIELDAFMNKIASTPEKYVLSEDGTYALPRALKAFNDKVATGGKNLVPPKLAEGAPLRIDIENELVQDTLQAHVDLNGSRVSALQEVHSVQGIEDSKDPSTIYPIRPNQRDFKHFAFVVDDKVSGAGHVSMIHATSERELQGLMDRVPSEFTVLTKKDTADYFKAQGEYQFNRGLNENYIDSSLQNKGINTQFFTRTDPNSIAQSFIEHHLDAESSFATELVRGKYGKEFGEFNRLGEEYTKVAASKYGSTNTQVIEATTKNPYVDYIKTALDISKISEYPLLRGVNDLLNSAYNSVATTLSNLLGGAPTPEALDQFNEILTRYGVKSAPYDAQTLLLVHNAGTNKASLSKFVSRANGLMTSLILRLDPLNAINNAVGANVLLGTETASILSKMRQGSPELQSLMDAMSTTLPTGDSIKTPLKLITAAMKDFVQGGTNKAELIAKYKAQGWITDITSQFHSMLDDLSIRGNEADSVLQGKLSSALATAKIIGQKGEVLTGNKLAEEFNRFVSSHVMDQITSPAVTSGVITQGEANSYINTFNNRVHGNIVASQRPLMFQGALGQAIGLFQSYQFNIAQQMLRYVGEGQGKDAAMLLGLQGTFFGLNGLPAFQAINQHIVGTLSNNPNHVDAYSVTYGVAGKSLGDLLLYGLPSNLLRTNLYSRGDINPRSLSVVPTNLADVPLVSGFVKTITGIKGTLDSIHQGGNVWNSILQGIEHTSLNRPLAGIAQVAEALASPSGVSYSTTTKGSILASNDIFSLANLSRVSGGKPFDEAVVNDATYRISAWQAAQHTKLNELAKSFKTTVIQGGAPSDEQINQFSEEYAKIGGKQSEFNKFMFTQIKQANTPQANKIMQALQNPYSQNMQEVMGGRSGDEVTF